MKIVVVGLGKMGHQIAVKLHQAGHEVLGLVRREEQAEELSTEGLTVTTDRNIVLDFFGGETARIWLMIPSDNVDAELASWATILPAGSMIIDGGNTKFSQTKLRAETAAAGSVKYVDVGTSGGVHGLVNGFSLMIGGNKEAYQEGEPLFQALALPRGAYQYFGESGSGHYVKMIHNAIEYGMMESLAEGYRMLEEGSYAGKIDLAAAGEVWQHGSVVSSWLNQLAQQALAESPKLEGVNGYVAESGEARWTLEDAKENNIPLPAIQSAFDVRLQSQNGETNFSTKLLAAMRNKFGGHAVNKQ